MLESVDRWEYKCIAFCFLRSWQNVIPFRVLGIPVTCLESSMEAVVLSLVPVLKSGFKTVVLGGVEISTKAVEGG